MLRETATGSQVLRRFNADAFHDVVLIMHASCKDVCSTVLPGDIHCVSKEPFMVHAYKEKTLRKFKQSLERFRYM